MEEKRFFHVNEEEKEVILFCFPYAGGGASVFRTWQEKIGKDIKIIPAHYPGHEERIMEKPFESMEDLVLNIYKEISELKEQPFYLFGHSVGSRVAYELAAKCEENGQENLKGMLVNRSVLITSFFTFILSAQILFKALRSIFPLTVSGILSIISI